MCDLRIRFQRGHDHVVRRSEKENREQNQKKIGRKKRPPPVALETRATGARILGNRGGHPISLPRLRTPRNMKTAETARIGNMNSETAAPSGRSPERIPSRNA